MKYLKLGNTDLNVSRICLGCMTYGEPNRGNHAWTLPEEQPPAAETGAGSRHQLFDTANSYSDGSSEEILGRALRDYARREDVVVATKVYFPLSNLKRGLSRANIMQSIDDSLRRRAPTMSICCRSTAGITKRRWKRRWKRCTTW